LHKILLPPNEDPSKAGFNSRQQRPVQWFNKRYFSY